jgi:Sec-independent protein translocase protein TatA
LPALGRSLGGGIRSFKDSITGGGRDDDGHDLAAGTAPVESDTARERRP